MIKKLFENKYFTCICDGITIIFFDIFLSRSITGDGKYTYYGHAINTILTMISHNFNDVILTIFNNAY